MDARLPPELETQLESESSDTFPAALAFLARAWKVPEELQSRLRSLIAEGGQDALHGTRLEFAGLVAAAERDQGVAATVAAAAVALAPSLREVTDVARLFNNVVMASAAFEDEGEWAAWLSARLADLAERVPAGSPALVFWHCLEHLKRVTKLALSLGLRAATVASAAIHP